MLYALIALGLDIALTMTGIIVGLIWQKLIDRRNKKCE